ncbi:28140_t:CDS:1, partial [Dentiscutata erythropus]
RRKQIKQVNQLQRKENEKNKNKNSLTTQNNETSIIQVPKSVRVEDFNEDDYITENEIEEVIVTGETSISVHQDVCQDIVKKRKLDIDKNYSKKQKINLICLDNKDSVIELNIQDEISLKIVGK